MMSLREAHFGFLEMIIELVWNRARDDVDAQIRSLDAHDTRRRDSEKLIQRGLP